MIRYVCPTCGKKIKSPPTRVGQKVRCPRCLQKILVPIPPSANKTVLGQIEPESLSGATPLPPPVADTPVETVPENYSAPLALSTNELQALLPKDAAKLGDPEWPNVAATAAGKWTTPNPEPTTYPLALAYRVIPILELAVPEPEPTPAKPEPMPDRPEPGPQFDLADWLKRTFGPPPAGVVGCFYCSILGQITVSFIAGAFLPAFVVHGLRNLTHCPVCQRKR